MGTGGIIAVGDSITKACSPDLAINGIPARSWAEWVSTATGEPLTVYAQSGAPSSVIRGLLPDDGSTYGVGLMFVGVNNIVSWRSWRKDDIEGDLRAIVAHIAQRAERVVVVQYPDMLGKAPAPYPYGFFLKARIRHAQAVLSRVVAEQPTAQLISPDLSAKDAIWFDGLHPTSVGHFAMGQAALEALNLPPVSAYVSAPTRPDFASWRTRQLVKFQLRQPAHAFAAWLLAR